MSKPSEDELRNQIREILDSNQTMVTLKNVRQKLEQHFGCPLRDRKSDIKNLVIEVNSQNNEAEEEEEESEEDEEIEIKPKKGKKKKKKKKRRRDSDDEDSDEPPQKKRKIDHVELNSSGKKRVVVQRYQGKLQVHIRNYYTKEGEYLPTKRGIALSVDEWKTLKDNFDDVDTMISQQK